MKEFIQRCGVILAILIIIVGIPLLVDYVYKMNGSYVTYFHASDILSYAGISLSFFSTLIFGILTLKLSNKSNKINERLLTIEEKRRYPYVNIDEEGINFTIGYTSFEGISETETCLFSCINESYGEVDPYSLLFKLQNYSDNIIINFYIKKIVINFRADEQFAFIFDNISTKNSCCIKPQKARHVIVDLLINGNKFQRSLNEYLEVIRLQRDHGMIIIFEFQYYNAYQEEFEQQVKCILKLDQKSMDMTKYYSNNLIIEYSLLKPKSKSSLTTN